MAKDDSDGSTRARATPTTQRLAKANAAIRNESSPKLDFLHTVLCQTGLPYRDPGDGQRVWNCR
jgi:hypothetical protein